MKKIYILILLSLFFLSGCVIQKNPDYVDKIKNLDTKVNDVMSMEGEESGQLIYVCEDKSCLVEKFEKCEIGQYVRDKEKKFKAYFLINGILNEKCIVLVEEDFQNGTLCEIPVGIKRTEDLFNELISYDFNSIEDYCKRIIAKIN